MNLPKSAYGKKIFWMRLGDNEDYEEGDLDSHLNILQEVIFGQTVRRAREGRHGLDCDSYQNLNYISLFVGDEDAQPIRPLTDMEIEYLNYWLNSER